MHTFDIPQADPAPRNACTTIPLAPAVPLGQTAGRWKRCVRQKLPAVKPSSQTRGKVGKGDAQNLPSNCSLSAAAVDMATREARTKNCMMDDCKSERLSSQGRGNAEKKVISTQVWGQRKDGHVAH